MKLIELVEHYSEKLAAVGRSALVKELDRPVTVSGGRLVLSAGSLHLYQLETEGDSPMIEDVPITVVQPGNLEPHEGYVVGRQGSTLWVKTFEAFGQTVGTLTLVPDTTGFYDTVATRLAEMARRPDKFSLGPAERLAPWFDPETSEGRQTVKGSVSTSVLTTVWDEQVGARRAKIAAQAIELVRANKRVLLISSDHGSTDEVVGCIGKAMRGNNLQAKSLVSRYEMPLRRESAGVVLSELGFQAQMHRFYAKSKNEKASLRRKYDRFRELTPLLAYKAEKQQDLDEVKLLEWRLLTRLNDLQGKIKEINQTLDEYERLPVLKRLGMQTLGKNVVSLGEYRTIYEEQVRISLQELEAAQKIIAELRPEAAIPKDVKPEYHELKEEIVRLGGTKKIRELLAAEEGTNRQAFIQIKRLVATTAARVISDPLFSLVRFDALIVDEAPRIPAPLLLCAAGLVRERIVIAGDHREIPGPEEWGSCQLGPSRLQSPVPPSSLQ